MLKLIQYLLTKFAKNFMMKDFIQNCSTYNHNECNQIKTKQWFEFLFNTYFDLNFFYLNLTIFIILIFTDVYNSITLYKSKYYFKI